MNKVPDSKPSTAGMLVVDIHGTQYEVHQEVFDSYERLSQHFDYILAGYNQEHNSIIMRRELVRTVERFEEEIERLKAINNLWLDQMDGLGIAPCGLDGIDYGVQMEKTDA